MIVSHSADSDVVTPKYALYICTIAQCTRAKDILRAGGRRPSVWTSRMARIHVHFPRRSPAGQLLQDGRGVIVPKCDLTAADHPLAFDLNEA